ncbi:hypothetical protein OAJ60_04130 [Planctomycetaceae bacterium]|nr:hypothetical protein [Planctomycetaceae bacterium]
MLKNVLLMAVVLAGSSVAADRVEAGDIWVRSYFRANGTLVKPHYRSRPDGNLFNNYSTYPNINPYTGKTGTRRVPSYRTFPANRPRSFSLPSYQTRNFSFPTSNSFRLGSFSTRSSRIRGW